MEEKRTKITPPSLPLKPRKPRSLSLRCNNEEAVIQRRSQEAPEDIDSGRERLKRHRTDVSGRVWIPEIWGQEEMLNDWVDCSAFDASLVPAAIMSARAALVEEGRRANWC